MKHLFIRCKKWLRLHWYQWYIQGRIAALIGLVCLCIGFGCGFLTCRSCIEPEIVVKEVKTEVKAETKDKSPEKKSPDETSDDLVSIASEEQPQTKIQEPVVTPVSDSEAIYIAKTVYGEARGLSKTEQAAVIWCILNRVDAYGSNIVSVVTAPNQFHGYSASNPVTDDIYSLVEDVLQRWQNEKTGAVDVGRVLPKEYLYFYGSGGHNHFNTGWRGGSSWNWSLPSPY